MSSISNPPTVSTPPAEGRAFPSGGTKAYVLPGVDCYSVGTNVPSSNQIRYQPFFVASTIVIDQLALEVVTGAASGTNARLAIYNADTNWQPTSLVVDGGDIAVTIAAGTGVKTVSVSATLTAGRYLLAINTDSNATFRNWVGGVRYGQFLAGLGASSFNDLWFVSSTYGAFASTGVAWTGTNGASTPAGMRYYGVLRVSTP
jgi:hypothetical protein